VRPRTGPQAKLSGPKRKCAWRGCDVMFRQPDEISNFRFCGEHRRAINEADVGIFCSAVVQAPMGDIRGR